MGARARRARLVGTRARVGLLGALAAASASLMGCGFWELSDWSDNVGASLDAAAADANTDASVAQDAGLGDGPATDGSATPLALDTFGRDVTNGLGSADIGGTWTLVNTPSAYAVHGGSARFTANAGQSVESNLTAVAVRDLDMTASFATSKVPDSNGIFASLDAHVTKKPDSYSLSVRMSTGGSALEIKLHDGTTLVNMLVPKIANAPNTVARLRFQVYGASPTHLRGRVWPDGTPEPTTWDVAADDSTSGLQGPGAVGLVAYVSAGATVGTVVATFDDLEVRAYSP